MAKLSMLQHAVHTAATRALFQIAVVPDQLTQDGAKKCLRRLHEAQENTQALIDALQRRDTEALPMELPAVEEEEHL